MSQLVCWGSGWWASGCGGGVAGDAFGAAPLGAVVVVVAEVPACAGWDGFAAAPAGGVAGFDDGFPLLA